MRHFLHFRTIGFLIIALLVPTARPQKPPPTKLPTRADYRAADDSCKHKLRLIAKETSRAVKFAKTVQCELLVHTCDGVVHYPPSEERPNVKGVCDDFYAAAAALQGYEVCCDPGSKEDKKNGNCQSPPPPWFVEQDCKDLQDPEILVTRESLDIYLCGYKIFSRNRETSDIFDDRLIFEAYVKGLRDKFSVTVPRKVCCNRFRDAARTGKPCNARVDVDCDGIPNNSDVTTGSQGAPEIDGQSFAWASDDVDPFPTGLTEDLIMPPADQCKNCKWELIKGELKCSQVSTKPHSYDATWRCPLTGAEINIVRLSKPGVPCKRS